MTRAATSIARIPAFRDQPIPRLPSARRLPRRARRQLDRMARPRHIRISLNLLKRRKAGGGGGGGGNFDFDPATARYIWTGDSIAALDDCTAFPYWGSGMAGGPMYMPPYCNQAVSGSEINEGTPASNPSDLLYPTRKQLLVDAAQAGDVVGIPIGTNTVALGNAATVIAGLKELYAAVLDKGAFVEAWTILPSASNIALADRATVNAFINSLDVDGFTSDSAVFYPPSKFCVIDGDAAWGGTYVGHTDSGNLHPNTNGALKLGRAKRAAYKAKGRAYAPLAYGVTNPSDNVLANWNLAAGTGGSLSGTGNTLVNNGVPTGIVVACTNNAGLTIQTDIVSGYTGVDSIYSAVAPVTALKVTVSGGAAALQADITITMSQSITSEPAGSAYESSCYARWKGVGATADPTGLFAFGFGYGSVCKFASQNSATNTNYTNITLGDEAMLRGRSVPTVQAFGSSSVLFTARVRSGETPSFEIYFAMPYAARRERVAYSIPKSLNTDQDSIGGARATGPQVNTSNTSWTATAGVAVTGRPGLAWQGGAADVQFTWQRDRGGVITDVAGPTTVTTTVGTTQFTPSGNSGDKFRLAVDRTNTFGTGRAYSVWSSALT